MHLQNLRGSFLFQVPVAAVAAIDPGDEETQLG
jgi:hypothetical protein